MRKIRASVLRKVEESRLTNKELTVFLHICQYQTEAGTVSGIYYKDICNALKISNQSFYSSLYRLRDCGLINLWKADKIDWDIQIIGNDCTDIEAVKKDKRKRRKTDIAALFVKGIDSWNKVLQSKHIIIEYAGKEKEVYLRCFPYEMETILSNLISNSKASFEKKRVKEKKIELSISEHEEYIRIDY